MPTTTVKQAGDKKTGSTKPAAARKKTSGSSANKTTVKAAKVNTEPVVLAFPPDSEKADTKPGESGGALRFAEVGTVADGEVTEYEVNDKGRPVGGLVGTLYVRKEQAKARWGKLPTGFEVTLTPTFD
jgi:hypothetical protein